jgi:hypothetical protein
MTRAARARRAHGVLPRGAVSNGRNAIFDIWSDNLMDFQLTFCGIAGFQSSIE